MYERTIEWIITGRDFIDMEWIYRSNRFIVEIKESISKPLQDIYEKTKVLHDGKWLWIPLDDKVMIMDKITMLKIKKKT